MTLFEFKAPLDVAQVEAADEVLLEQGDERWSVMHDVLLPAAWVIGVFEAREMAEAAWLELRPRLSGIGEAVIRAMPEAEWRDSYKLHFKPWRSGRLHWVPVWERATYSLPPDDVAIWLDPGLAFGTGNHETTRLCCDRLVAWAQTARPEARVVDAGCGSGILAISAARLGFRAVQGFDNDPEAVRVSVENATVNELADAVTFYEGDLVTGWRGGPADLVMANILGHVLTQFVPELVTAVAPGGLLVLSGILASELDQVRDAFTAAVPHWRVETRVLGEWADVALWRP